MTKFLTLNRSLFIVGFLMLALVGMATLWGGSTVHGTASDAMLMEDDLAYVESNSTFAVSTGSYSGGGVTFGLDGAYASASTVESAMVSADLSYTDSAGCVSEGISEGAADASFMTVNTSGYSLPLQSDTYLPVNVSGTYAGTDVYAETSFSGTILARQGFSTTNPDFEMVDTSTSVGVSYADYSGGGGTCCGTEDRKLLEDGVSLNWFGLGNSSFMPASFMPAHLLLASAASKDKVKEKNYKLNFRKKDGIPSFTSGTVKKWKSNVPGTEDLANVSLVIDSTSFQYDAASGTINLKQKFHLKKAKK